MNTINFNAKLVRGVVPTIQEFRDFYNSEDDPDRWIVYMDCFDLESGIIGFEILSAAAGESSNLTNSTYNYDKEKELIELLQKYKINPDRISTHLVCQIY